MIGFTNASSGISFQEYTDTISEMKVVSGGDGTLVFSANDWSIDHYDTTTTTNIIDVTVTTNTATFRNAVGNVIGKYIFTFDGTSWYLEEAVVTLSDYGITISGEGTPVADNVISVVLSEVGPFIQTIALTRISSVDTPIISVYIPAEIPGEGLTEYMASYNAITKIDTENQNLKATCYETKPTTDVYIMCKGV